MKEWLITNSEMFPLFHCTQSLFKTATVDTVSLQNVKEQNEKRKQHSNFRHCTHKDKKDFSSWNVITQCPSGNLINPQL
jgi:hypothetical protein